VILRPALCGGFAQSFTTGHSRRGTVTLKDAIRLQIYYLDFIPFSNVNFSVRGLIGHRTERSRDSIGKITVLACCTVPVTMVRLVNDVYLDMCYC
jgi:hypothetical protein